MTISNRQKLVSESAYNAELAYNAIKSAYENAVEESTAKFPFNFDSLDSQLTIEQEELNAEIADLRTQKEKAFWVWQSMKGYSIRDNYTID